jgi:predicted permease
MLDDVRHSVRALGRTPAFALAATATLALGIGASTAIFTLTNAVLLADLPVPHPDRLIEISTLNAKGEKSPLSVPAFRQLQQQADMFQGLFGWLGGGMENLEVNGTPFAGAVDEVTGEYYQTLGIQPALGRFITPDDAGAANSSPSHVAVLGYRCWRDRYAGDPAALGKTVLVAGKPYTIIGVQPESFGSLIREAAADVTVPIAAYMPAEMLSDPERAFLSVFGRLRDGITMAEARARLSAVWPGIRDQLKPGDDSRIEVEPAARGVSYLRQRVARPLGILLGIVALLLLLACVNLANLGLARAQSRTAELSLRAALGAGRFRLLRTSLVESLLLSLAGAIPGIAFAWWGARFIAGIMWHGFVPLAVPLAPDARVLSFTVVVSIAAGLLSGVAPAWIAGRQDPGAVLQRASTRISHGPGWAGRALVAVQIALSFAIVAGALLFGRSLGNLLRRDPGFSADHLLVAQLFPRGAGYRGFDNLAYFRQLLESLRTLGGVSAAAISHDRPIGFAWKQTVLPGPVAANYHLVTPGFFDTLQMKILRGRDFDIREDASRPRVAIVSASLARRLFPAGDPIGRDIQMGDKKTEAEIVGIVSDANLGDPRTERPPCLYTPFFQDPGHMGWGEAIIRTNGDPAQLARGLGERIEALGREYPLRIETVREERDYALVPERILTFLCGFFGAAAILLAAVGLYGLLSLTVTRRSTEIGIRMALGAPGRAVLGLVLRDTLLLLGIGGVAGLALALVASRSMASLLYGLPPADPATLALTAAVLAMVALMASYVPARRAIRIDPATALRSE